LKYTNEPGWHVKGTEVRWLISNDFRCSRAHRRGKVSALVLFSPRLGIVR
jgi:hypothetical protein